jgi:hypothetical protein
MKAFRNTGIGATLTLAGATLLFASCLGPSSSDDNAIPAKSGEVGAKFVYKFSVTPEQGKLDIVPVVMDTGIATCRYGPIIQPMCGPPILEIISSPCTWASPP